MEPMVTGMKLNQNALPQFTRESRYVPPTMMPPGMRNSFTTKWSKPEEMKSSMGSQMQMNLEMGSVAIIWSQMARHTIQLQPQPRMIEVVKWAVHLARAALMSLQMLARA